MFSFTSDIQHAWRGLRKNPAFLATVMTVLALGIGGTAVIFAVINAVLLRPLPFPHQEQLVRLFSSREGTPWTTSTMSPPNFTDYRRQAHSFSELAAVNEGDYALTGGGPAEQLPGAEVTGGFFPTLAVPPLLGRGMTPADDDAASPRVAVLGYGLWQRRFGGDRGIIGRTIQLDGEGAVVIGVMPRGFNSPGGSEVWLPLRFTPTELRTQRGAHYLDVLGRLRDGTSREEAAADLGRIAHNLAVAYPKTNEDISVRVLGLRESMVGDVRAPLLILLAAVGLVLLIACTNVAGLLLVRGWRRQRELAIRTAMGAARGRIVRILLAESLLLALLGGAAAILLAVWGTALIARLTAVHIPLLGQTRLDTTVLAFTAGMTLLTALVFGLVPAWLVSSPRSLPERLKAEGRGSSGRRTRSRNLLVVIETALAVLLLTGAGLLLRSFDQLRRVEPGYDPHQVLTFGLSLPDATYPPERSAAFFQTYIQRVEALPGVQAAGAIFGLPLTGFGYSISALTLDGRQLSQDEQSALSVQIRVVTPDFFKALRIPIRQGRGIEPTDRAGTPPVIVINRAAARRVWPGIDPLGHQLVVGTRLGLGGAHAGGEVVGVIGDLKDRSLAAATEPTIYLAHAQFPTGYMSVAIRTAGDPLLFARSAQQALAATDPDVPAFHVRSMEQLVASSIAQPRLYTTLLTLFAAVAILLAATGLYGVLAQGVAQRRRELGIRVALGATAAEVIRLVLRQAAFMAAGGVLLGMLAGVAATRLLSGLLFGVPPRDPVTFATVALLLLGVCLVAGWLPARRAARVDPMTVMREE